MSRVILVNPPLGREERYGKLAIGGSYMPPLGLSYLASSLKENGFEVFIVDCEALSLSVEKGSTHILGLGPDFIGITSTTVSVNHAARLALCLKKTKKEIPIILGGSHVTVIAEETMQKFPQFDIGVLGEGELTIVELLKALEAGDSLDEVRGLIVRVDKDLVKVTEPREVIEDLDKLPFPALDLLPDLTRYYRPSVFGFKKLPAGSLITSRGCPGRCSFCNQGPFGKRYREHSAGYVMEMIKVLYYKYGVRDIAIYDGTFGINKKRFVLLCEMLIKEGLDLVWSSNARVDLITLENLRLMKRAGCWSVAYGIESGAQEIIDFLQKGIKIDEVRRVLDMTRKAGIVTKGYFMLGAPMETEETMQKTLDFVLTSSLDLVTMNNYTPLPGTKDYDRVSEYGKFNKDWRLLNEHNIVFVPNGLTARQIDHSIRKITRRFYLRPRIILYYLKMAFIPRNFILLFKGFLAFMKFIVKKDKVCV